MIKILLVVTFISSAFLSFGQLAFNKTKHDFGDLEAYSLRYVDIEIKNTGAKQEWILSVKKPFEVIYITSKQIIEKDSSVIVRFQVNPKERGKFAYAVQIFTSDRAEATDIKITGNLREVQQDGSSSFTACPNFNERPGGKNPNDFDLTVVTIDKESRETLSKSSVTMIQGGQPVWQNKTDKNGKIKEESTLGLSYFYATHEGYSPTELGAYVNFQRNYIVLELERNQEVDVPVVVEEPDVIAEVPDPEPEPEIVIEISETLEEELNQEPTPEIAEVLPELAELDPENFDDQYFDPVNVVFVLDVSSSMQQIDKIELMKYALFQLTDMIRPQDKMGIVTYASDARVLLQPTSGGDKQAIKAEVGELKAFGYTAGGSGIKLGFKQANKAKIEGGVNHVIVITDGAFNRNSSDYKKYVKKYQKKGITMSVVGIKNKPNDEDEMREAAELGKGRYIPIFKLADAQRNLKQEIRVLAFKKRK